MYERFYGLRERPFDLAADPRYLLLTRTHHEALVHLTCGLTPGHSITLLVGDAGTGKTTLLRSAVMEGACDVDAIVSIDNPTLTRAEFLEALADGFGLSPRAAVSKPRLLAELTDALERCVRAGGRAALVVDEAQALPDELLEEIRLLSNVRSPSVPQLPIILAGQPELAQRLHAPAMAHFRQRVALRYALSPLDLQGSAAYISGRLQIAGGDAAAIFTSPAVGLVHERSGGIPRTISVICENALISGFAEERRPIDRDIVEQVCADFDLGGRDLVAAPILAPLGSILGAPGDEALDARQPVRRR
jgi:general secretion pathway protein A